jgi:SAM-dependent methyltransferase
MPAENMLEEPSLGLFQREWKLYRKVVDNNYLFHREAYAQLHRILVDEAVGPFRFLDIACGDARAAAGALKGTRVAHYHGIDLSQAALNLAANALATLRCPIKLERRDFVEALRAWSHPVDVAWIGLSLHHLRTPTKLTLMRKIRSMVGERGLFLIYEGTNPDGEDRAAWLRRHDGQKPFWTALTLEEWESITAHVHTADFPETTSQWHSLGREAGFTRVRQLFVAPSNLFRMYCFQV